MKRISDYCLKNNLVDLAIDVAEAANYIKFEIQKQFWMNLENYLEKKGLIVLNDNEKDDLSYVYDDEKIMKYYFNQKNNKHYGIPILLQKFESGEEAILMIKLENTLYFSILVAKKGKYLSFDKYKSKIPFEKKLNTFSHNWQSSSTGPAWYWKHPSIHSIPMNFKTFEQKEIRDLSDPKKLNVFVNKLGDEVFDLVQRFKRARN
jgi:hypothetical protein